MVEFVEIEVVNIQFTEIGQVFIELYYNIELIERKTCIWFQSLFRLCNDLNDTDVIWVWRLFASLLDDGLVPINTFENTVPHFLDALDDCLASRV